MIRRLLMLLTIVAGMVAVRGILRAFRTARVNEPAAGARFEGAMVRDRICGTFLPRARALTLRVDGEEHFFCSESCRSAFLDRVRPSH